MHGIVMSRLHQRNSHAARIGFLSGCGHLMLDQRFYRHVTAAAFPEHSLRFRNDRAAAGVGLDGLDDQAWVEHFGKFTALPDNIETPLALCYRSRGSTITIGLGMVVVFSLLRCLAA